MGIVSGVVIIWIEAGSLRFFFFRAGRVSDGLVVLK